MNKLSLFSWLNELSKQSALKGQHNFILFYIYVADPATFLASNNQLWFVSH